MRQEATQEDGRATKPTCTHQRARQNSAPRRQHEGRQAPTAKPLWTGGRSMCTTRTQRRPADRH
eukprot:11680922-Alexandrium_andersonii.AAC.1